MKKLRARVLNLLVASIVTIVATCCPALLSQTHDPKTKLVSVEKFGADPSRPLLILLHGANGPSAFYREQASFFAGHGYQVVLPHYLEAGKGEAATDSNYDAWTVAVSNVIDKFHEDRPIPTVIVGYSLGASVALALGSKGNGPDAIAEFYGSLPDNYYRDLKGMPPLLILHGEKDSNVPVYNARQLSQLCAQAGFTCDTHIYPSEEHGFRPDALKDADQRVLQFFETNLRK